MERKLIVKDKKTILEGEEDVESWNNDSSDSETFSDLENLNDILKFASDMINIDDFIL